MRFGKRLRAPASSGCGGEVFPFEAVYGAGTGFRVHPCILLSGRPGVARRKFLADGYTRDSLDDQDFAPRVFQVTIEDKDRNR
jgi:hypothetical protein